MRNAKGLESEPVVISPTGSLELAFLRAIGRLGVEPRAVVDLVRKSLGLAIVSHELVDVTRTAETLSFTRDPFDRMLCAHAVVARTALVTADRVIRTHFDRARW